jgi:hypothetical protein
MQQGKPSSMPVPEPNPKERLLCNKEIASMWGVSLRTVTKRMKLLNVLPTVPLHSRNEWSRDDFEELVRKWLEHVKKCARKKKRVYA